MSLAQKMLQNNGITPAADADKNKGQDGNQNGDGTGASADGGGDGDGGDGGASNGQDANNSASHNNEGAGQNSGTDGENNNAGAGAQELENEESIIKALEKKGIKVNSLSELSTNQGSAEPTPEEKEELEQKRQNAIRSFALQTGKVTTTLLDNYIRESSVPETDLAFSIYKSDRLAELKEAKTPADEMPKDEDILNEFNELNFQHADETDPKRKAAEKRMKKTVGDYLQSKYEPIYNLEDEYTNHQNTLQIRSSYDSEVSQAISAIGDKIEFEIVDDKQKIVYPVKLTPEQIEEIKSLYTGDEMFNSIGGSGVKKDGLVLAMKNSIIAKNFNKIVSEVATAHSAAKISALKLGRREIFTNTNTGDDAAGKQVKAGVKKMLNKNNINSTSKT